MSSKTTPTPMTPEEAAVAGVPGTPDGVTRYPARLRTPDWTRPDRVEHTTNVQIAPVTVQGRRLVNVLLDPLVSRQFIADLANDQPLDLFVTITEAGDPGTLYAGTVIKQNGVPDLVESDALFDWVYPDVGDELTALFAEELRS